jgi:hypothetical protein
MKLGRIVDPKFQNALAKLAAQEISPEAAMTLKENILDFNVELKKYDETRKEAIQRLANKNEDGSLFVDAEGMAKLDGDNLKSYQDQFTALLDSEVSVKTVKISDVGAKAFISVEDLILLHEVVVR